MTKSILASALAVMTTTIMAFCCGYWFKGREAPDEPPRRRQHEFAVTGEATVDAPIQYVRISAEVRVPDLETPVAAKLASDEIVKAIIAICGKHGIARADVDGTQVSVGPRMTYNQEERRSEQHGYEAVRSLSVKLTDVEALDMILTALVSQDHVTIQGVQFDSDSGEESYHRALDLAVQAARRRAEHLAAAAGFRIICITDIDDIGWAEFLRERLRDYERNISATVVDGRSSFSKKSVEVTAKVRATYEIELISEKRDET